MKFRLFAIISIFIFLFMFSSSIVGLGWTTIGVSILLFLQAVLYHFKAGFYGKYMNFVNPAHYELAKSKGDAYFSKRKKNEIIGMYMLSCIMAFNGIIQLKLVNDSTPFYLRDWKAGIIFILIIVLFVLGSVVASRISLKKAKTPGEEVILNLAFGIVITIVMFTALIAYIVISFR